MSARLPSDKVVWARRDSTCAWQSVRLTTAWRAAEPAAFIGRTARVIQRISPSALRNRTSTPVTSSPIASSGSRTSTFSRSASSRRSVNSKPTSDPSDQPNWAATDGDAHSMRESASILRTTSVALSAIILNSFCVRSISARARTCSSMTVRPTMSEVTCPARPRTPWECSAIQWTSPLRAL